MEKSVKFSMVVKNNQQFSYYRDLLDRGGHSDISIRIADVGHKKPLPSLRAGGTDYEGEEAILDFLIENDIIQGVI